MNFWDILRFFGIFQFFDRFWQFLDFWGFYGLFGFFLTFLIFFGFFFGFFFKFFRIFWIFGFLDFQFFGFFFEFFLDFFSFFWFLSKVIWLLLNVTMVTTGHQKSPKMGQNSLRSSFFARRAKKASAEGQSPPQELEVGPRSGPYVLVYCKYTKKKN